MFDWSEWNTTGTEKNRTTKDSEMITKIERGVLEGAVVGMKIGSVHSAITRVIRRKEDDWK